MKKLGRLTFIRQLYRRLLEKDRTYAAFEKDDILPLLETNTEKNIVLDPMSGYGTLMNICAQKGLPSFSVEKNPPAYYWQYLNNPKNYFSFDLILNKLKEVKTFPNPRILAGSSKTFFPKESKRLLPILFEEIISVVLRSGFSDNEAIDISLSVLLPFVGRFSSFVQGNIVIELKSGGICVYKEWQEDFISYLNFLQERLKQKYYSSRCKDHQIILGDSQILDLKDKKFKFFITSPPYPNFKDYYKIFEPENIFLRELIPEKYRQPFIKGELIGSIKVKNRKTNNIVDLLSSSAKEFLQSMLMQKGTLKQINDIRNYYYPYFLNYFIDLQKTYINISTWLDSNAVGYIIVVNNTSRKKIIPLSDFTQEVFNSLGFNTEIHSSKSTSHVGNLNPKITGISAIHQKFTIRISRNDKK